MNEGQLNEPDNQLQNPDLSARILIMDDDEMVLTVCSSMLSELGHQTRISRDGDECIRIYKQMLEDGTPPDLVILDLTIPGGKGGQETALELKQLNPGARIIVSSGYSNDPIMASYREHSFAGAIAKPYVIDALADVIASALEEEP